MRKFAFTLAVSLFIVSGCQQKTLSEKAIQQNLKDHISFLADDKLEGRLTGSAGAKKAGDYIIQTYKEIGLTAPDKDQDFRQPFDFTMKKYAAKPTSLQINEKELVLNKDYFPLAFSSNDSVTAAAEYVKFGINAPDLDYNDYKFKNNLKGKIFVIEISSPDGIHPHSKYVAYHDLDKRIDMAKEQGAAGIIFVNSRDDASDPKQQISVKIQPRDIPVFFLKNDDYIDQLDGSEVTLQVDIKKQAETGHNIYGMIDHGQAKTVVIGAHYDHLGYGQQGSSLSDGDSAIHNGADDNASGVAMMMELARSIQQNDTIKNHNYLFVAFSGEELGLYGSNYFVDHAPFSADSIHYMLNMDMVGRLDSTNTLIINGTGTSPTFANLDSLPIAGLSTKTSSSGIGPSDHTPFYLEQVPVVHFFTGTHGDYHKPSDDQEKINYEGMIKVYHYIMKFIAAADEKSILTFTETDDKESEKAPDFSVTLGVVPDYIYDGEGMKIDAVRKDRTAEKAGLQDGDIVIKMGPVNVKDMHAYMKALGYFKKGDTTDVKVKRNSDTLNFQVIF